VPDGRLRLSSDEPLRRRRLAVLLRLVLLIPHYIVLTAWTVPAIGAVAIAWLALLIEGRLPTFLDRFLAAFLRYQTQVIGWAYLLSGHYPDPLHTLEHPLRIELPERPRQPRLVTLFRPLLSLPALVLASVFNVVLSTISIPAWFVSLARASTTEGLQELGLFCLRYQLEAQAYAMLLLSAYPRLAPPPEATTEPA
jgi:hypothetical protein